MQEPKLNPENALMLNTLAYILYTPRSEVFKEVEAARARAKEAPGFHLTPQTEDEHLLSLWTAVVSLEEERKIAAEAAGK
jgi:hypothetical protein